ncbi:thiopurine S-methyltransferase [Roseibium album]|uniref:thiopurine S-methyltransferase n=1 Tax=Roseibium album TaxID=311410 RepID=UPI0032EE633D
MDKRFWQTRWQEGKIAFHEGVPNRHLVRHFMALSLSAGSRVFVPFCGKTADLDWLLSQGYGVSGIELNQDAVGEVFERLALTPDVARFRGLTRFSGKGIVVWVGDFFELSALDLGSVDAVYDRAALVALPAQMRTKYVRHLQSLCPSVPQLLVSYDYDQGKMEGPPFSLPEDHVRSLYKDIYEIENLASVDIYGPLAERCSGREESWILRPIGQS